MKRLGTQEIVLLNMKLRLPAILKSILGLGFIVLIYICIGGIHTNNCDKKDAYVASIFGSDFAANQIIRPNVAMHAQRNCNSDTFPDSINNQLVRCQGGEATQFIKISQFTIKKIILDDEYETGKLFLVTNIHFVPRVIASNTIDSTAQTEINYMKLENSPSVFKVYGQDCKSWNRDFIKQGSK